MDNPTRISLGIAFVAIGVGLLLFAFPKAPDMIIYIGVAICAAVAIWGLFPLVRPNYWKSGVVEVIPKPRTLEYLNNKDVELDWAIKLMAHKSAWGRWYAAQHLVNSKNQIGDQYLYNVASGVVHHKILNGTLVVRGRMPGKLDFEPIDRTYWRSSTFTFLPDPMSLWRMEIIPVGGVLIEADGTMKADHKPSEKRNAVIRKYDSLLIDAHEFEGLWPKNKALEDEKRKLFLKQAKKQGLDKQTIKLLS